MGCLFFFDEEVSKDDDERVRCVPQQVEVLDNHGVPEVVIGPIGNPTSRATFNDWEQFERFVESINELKSRIAPIHQ